MSEAVEHSRALLLATRASDQTPESLLSHMESTTVLLSGEADLVGGIETLGIVATTLRRMPGQLVLNPTGLADDDLERILSAVTAIDPYRGIVVTSNPVPPGVHVHVGTQAPQGAIRSVPHRHGGHLLVDPAVVIPKPTDVSGLGVVFTASVAAAEVFKTLAAVVPARRRSPGHIAFCPVTLGPDPARAPRLGGQEIELAIIGLGAIGTAEALILSLLPIGGHLLVVDPQAYAPENLGTYSLGVLADAIARPQKTVLAQRALSHWDVEPFNGTVAELVPAIDDGLIPWPRTVMAALDEIGPRHDTQLLWPDLLIDAGTGDTSVGMHEFRPWGPCEQCAFPIRRGGPSTVDYVAQATGLAPAYLAVDALLDAETVAQLPEHQRNRLRPLIGTPRCSLAQALGLTQLNPDGYQPAVPFVAQQAACLAVGRLVAHLSALDVDVTQFQYDVLRGSDLAHAEQLAPQPDCYCQQHATRIDKVRAVRGQQAHRSVPPRG